MYNRKEKKSGISILKAMMLCFMVAVLPVKKILAQPIPVGGIREDQFRILQLLSDSTITASFTNRPIWFSTYRQVFDNSNADAGKWWGKPLHHPEKSFSLFDYDIKLGGYEPVLTNTYNNNLPYGQNNGAAWYGRGLNTELQGGFYLTSDYLTVTFRPHLIYTQNKAFEPPRFLPRYPNGDIRYVAPTRIPEFYLGDRIDRPFRFGPDSYGTIDWGQSSIRLHYNKIEAGIGKGTLWWGPGVQYALAMSNNAPGLRHAFLGTREPVALPLNIGDIEFRWIFAWPQDSQFFDLNIYGINNREKRMERVHALQSTRFMNGLNVVYTPSFLPNLSLGVSRIIQQYVPDGGLSFSDDILGVFKAFPKPGNEVLEDARVDGNFENEDPVASVFFRWVFPESDAEFYGELYKGDHNVSLRDFLMEPQHGRAYTIGIQKLLEFDGAINFVKVNAEFNTLEEGPIDEQRPQTYIYSHATIRQGHTNGGQLLGAEIGPGSSSQFLGIDGYFKQGKLGIFFQREVINNHFHYEKKDRYLPLGGFADQIHHRINLNLGLTGSYKMGPVLLRGEFTWNRNFNYGRTVPSGHSTYTTPVPIIDNLQYQLAVRYLF